jgi:hypothetical protein
MRGHQGSQGGGQKELKCSSYSNALYKPNNCQAAHELANPNTKPHNPKTVLKQSWKGKLEPPLQSSCGLRLPSSGARSLFSNFTLPGGVMKDSNLGLPGLRMPEPVERVTQPGRDRRRPARPAAQTKLRRRAALFLSGPRTNASRAKPAGPHVRPPRGSPTQRRRAGREARATLQAPHGPTPRGPRGLPPLAGLFSKGPAVGLRETKETLPPAPASPRTPSPFARAPPPVRAPASRGPSTAGPAKPGPRVRGQPAWGRTHHCSTRTTGSRWGTWLSPERCRRWS